MGLSGVMVHLLDAGGAILHTTSSGADGFYSFHGLNPAQQYRVQFVLPMMGYTFSPYLQGGDPAKDSNANPTHAGKSGLFQVPMGQFKSDIDGGLVAEPPASVGDFVWHDQDADGTQDGGEPGVQGVMVHLLNTAAGFVINSTTTDFNGKYQFSFLNPAQQYRVQFVLPMNYTFSPYQQGGDPAKDSDANPADAGKSPLLFQVPAGKANNDIDAGLVQALPGSVVTSSGTTRTPTAPRTRANPASRASW